jgi:DNA invertase Pin-like site-specific DNA recombinase
MTKAKTNPTETTPTPTRAVGYVRVSTDDQAASGLGLEAQTETIRRAAEARGWVLVHVYVDAGVSGKVRPQDRPALGSALVDLEAGAADVLVVAKLDRLARSVVGLSELLDLSQRSAWGLVLLDSDVDTSTAGGRMVANVMGVVAQWEREVISERTTAAMAAAKARGQRLGRPVELAHETRVEILRLRWSGHSLQAIADTMTEAGVPTARGGRWHPSTVRAVLRSHELDYANAIAEGAVG